jgi:hypothetical protein
VVRTRGRDGRIRRVGPNNEDYLQRQAEERQSMQAEPAPRAGLEN